MQRDQFPLDRTFKNGFIYFAPALTYTAPFPESEIKKQVVDTTYVINSQPNGKFSFGIELGWYHSFENPIFFHYLEGGVAYRSFAGSSDISLSKEYDNVVLLSRGKQDYKVEHLSGVFRAIQSKQLGKFTFFTWGPGLNFDYHLTDNRNINSDVFEKTQQDLKMQFHLQLGFGFRMTEKIIFLPQLEIPLLEAYPTGKWEATHAFAENHLYPLVLSFKIMLLRNDPMNCNAPEIPKGFN